MKKILIISLFIVLFLTTACTKVVEAQPVKTITVTQTSIVKIEDTTKISELEKQLKDSKVETEKYKELIANLNDLLKNVYYGWAINNIGGVEDGFTAFSMEYKDKYYLITAGHAIENTHGKFYNFKFKANFTSGWIYPKLLTFENDYLNRDDYAIFYSDKIKTGFEIDNENDIPVFIMGIEKYNIIKDKYKGNTAGESGSPIIDLEGEIIGILTTDISSYYTNISKVKSEIDNLN